MFDSTQFIQFSSPTHPPTTLDQPGVAVQNVNLLSFVFYHQYVIFWPDALCALILQIVCVVMLTTLMISLELSKFSRELLMSARDCLVIDFYVVKGRLCPAPILLHDSSRQCLPQLFVSVPDLQRPAKQQTICSCLLQASPMKQLMPFKLRARV